MSARNYLTQLAHLVERLQQTQLPEIERAAAVCAAVIGGGGLVHLFGTGHGSLPALESFPRTGSFVGWHPIVEPALGPHLRIGGEGGVHQFRFLQAAEGYGKAILDAQPVHDEDAFILCSHSGVNPVVVEVAMLAKARGLPVIAVTSLEHSRRVASRHSSGKRLFESADVVIDTQAPFGDAVLEIGGVPQRVAAVSTSLACAVINALVAETAVRLVTQGRPPLIIGHIDREGRAIPHELRAQYRREFLNRLWRR